MVSGISQANDGTAVSPNEGVVVDALMMFSKTSLVSSGPPDRQDPNFRRSLGVRSSQGFSPWGGYFFHFLTLKTRTEFMGILEVQQYNKDTQRWRPCYKTAQTLRQFSGSVFFLGGGGQLPILYIPRTSKYPYKSCFTPDITSSYFCLAILQGRLKHLDQQPIDHMHRHKAWPLSSGARLSDHHAEIWGSSSKLRSCGALLPWISCQVNHGSSCEVL